MKILVLVHTSLIPPEKPQKKEEAASAQWATEYDVVQALKGLDHSVRVLGVDSETKSIRDAIDEFKPHVVFNLLEEFAGQAVFDQNVVSYLEMLGVKYTGCNPRGLILSRDKALTKKILAYHHILSPKFQVFPFGQNFKKSNDLQYPLFVKTLNEEASLGISQESIVNNDEQLRDRIQHLHDKYQVDVIAETFVPGREFYVSIMGEKRLQIFPVWELFFNKAPDSNPKIATRKVKWDLKYRKKYGIKTGLANIDEDLAGRIQDIARRTYKALSLTGYARIDIRVSDQGEIFVIEANPNPDIGDGDEFAESAKEVGVDYQELISKIVRLARSS